MPHLTAAELRRIERQYSEGIKSSAIVDIFQGKGYRFSEATLRKYVQLGLLPKSRRVGLRGRHRGSSGLYPVCIVRLINEIKAALDGGATLEEVRLGIGLASELQVLQACADSLMTRFTEAVALIPDVRRRGALRRQVDREQRTFRRWARDLRGLTARIGKGETRSIM